MTARVASTVITASSIMLTRLKRMAHGTRFLPTTLSAAKNVNYFSTKTKFSSMTNIQATLLICSVLINSILIVGMYRKLAHLTAAYKGLLETYFSMRDMASEIVKSDKSVLEVLNNANTVHNWYVPSIKYLLIALSKYVEEMKKQAVKDERYEEAKKCNEALLEMYKLINA